MDAREYQLQRNGTAAALNSPDIRDAILKGQNGQVALAMYEWSGRNQQALILNWQLLQSHAAIDRAIAQLLETTRSFNEFPTAMGWSLGYGAGILQKAPQCDRQVIDVSGDGINNDGFSPSIAYKHFPFEWVTVNGLVVLSDDAQVDTYYREEVLKGPGAFLEKSFGYEGFQDAMSRKLLREINDLTIGQIPADHKSPG